MPARSKPALWRCPKCGHRFVTRNLWHSCVRVPISAHFRGKPRLRKTTFDQWLAAARACGRVTAYGQKSRISIMARVRFAGAVVHQSYVDAALWMRRSVEHRTLRRTEDFGRLGQVHHFRLETPDDVDGALKTLMREAYRVGTQELTAKSMGAGGVEMAAKKGVRKKTVRRASSGKRASRPARKKGGAWTAVFAPRAPGEKRYWLVKSEPEVFSFDDLLRIHNKTTHWNGIRNFAARNFMKDGMKVGDRVFFYHSMAETPGIVGICEVVREGYPDFTALDPSNDGYDPKATREAPIWYMVDLRAVAQLTRAVTLAEIKGRKELKNMALVRIGRLSVSPVSGEEWRVITDMANK